ncbi:MAG: class I SAM-dependent methyltransferase [Novosphingobium sp.]
MPIRDNIHRALRKLGLVPPHRGIADFAVDAQTARVAHQPDECRLADRFYAHHGCVVHKWTHYPAIYETYFARFVGQPLHMLEIGVFKGGSLQLWRDCFGPEAVIFGIDIDPACANLPEPPTQVRIGSQDDPAFLRAVVADMGGLDLVLDDGSHYAPHQRRSFETLFPLLSDGGLYVIEDTHTAYWPGSYQGGYRRPGTAIELAKRLIDDMHAHYHGYDQLPVQARDWIPAIHIHDSIIVIEKARRERPAHVQIGGTTP